MVEENLSYPLPLLESKVRNTAKKLGKKDCVEILEQKLEWMKPCLHYEKRTRKLSQKLARQSRRTSSQGKNVYRCTHMYLTLREEENVQGMVCGVL